MVSPTTLWSACEQSNTITLATSSGSVNRPFALDRTRCSVTAVATAPSVQIDRCESCLLPPAAPWLTGFGTPHRPGRPAAPNRADRTQERCHQLTSWCSCRASMSDRGTCHLSGPLADPKLVAATGPRRGTPLDPPSPPTRCHGPLGGSGSTGSGGLLVQLGSIIWTRRSMRQASSSLRN